ncbi:ileal sodium/bile acid cotransporter [Procambarus clarkii]|uniref:ileal sodium/bile acid cotransporter n=1 Tax=Procambarus clarkii TaxID=6728 RepID=UPI0037425416
MDSRDGRLWKVVVIVLMASAVCGQEEVMEEEVQEAEPAVWFSPEALLGVLDGSHHTITWFTNTTSPVARVAATVDDKLVSEVASVSEVQDASVHNLTHHYSGITYYGHLNITAIFIGFNKLHLVLYDEDNVTVAEGAMEMTVLLSYQHITKIFTFIIAFLVGILYFCMGATLDLQVVKEIVKKPVGPIIGLFCQYVLMPLIAFVLGLILFSDDSLLRLGLFINGSSPGGGASNMWTHLLGGSLNLSIMMTTVSTVFAFITVPLWVLAMGPVILKDAPFVIPYGDIAVTVISLIIPCGFGVLLQIFYPKSVKYCAKAITPVSTFNLIFMFTFGIYAYHYIFSIFTWKMVVSGFMLPSLGYLAGMVFGFVFRLPLPEVIAISVETGVQNASIALIILQLTLASPGGELSAVVPAASTMFTPLPLVVMFLIKKIYERFIRGRSLSINSPDVQPKASEIPNDVRDTSMATLEKTGRLENGVKSIHEPEGVDNPAADFKDDV